MTKITNEQDELEEVTFEPELVADDELVVTDSKAAETDIKTALDTIDDAAGKVKKYNPDRPETEDEKLMLRMKELSIDEPIRIGTPDGKVKSDGSTASYYELPRNAAELQDLISHRNMNAQMGEIFRECYRYGLSEHCDMMRGAKKIKFYAEAEIERLKKLEGK